MEKFGVNDVNLYNDNKRTLQEIVYVDGEQLPKFKENRCNHLCCPKRMGALSIGKDSDSSSSTIF